MNPSNENIVDYSMFGGKKIEPQSSDQGKSIESQNVVENAPKMDYSQFGGKPVNQEKAGKAESALNGFIEAVLGIPALAQLGVNEFSKGLEESYYGKEENPQSFAQENPLLNYLGSLPESKDESSRRIRTGVTGATLGAFAGIPGIIAGVVGSQAGQTVRELYGKEGKFENFGWGEVGAITADLVAGLGTGIVSNALKTGVKQGANAVKNPAIFNPANTRLEKAVVKNAVQGEKNALQEIVDNFSRSQINQFESDISALAPSRYNEITQVPLSGIQRQAENMHRQGVLGFISPLQVTPEQGGSAIQQSANEIFNQEVIAGERAAYTAAKEAAENLSGTTPKTIEEAKKLRDSLIASAPSKEQNPLVDYLNNLISDLETSTPASTSPASSILGPNGKPIVGPQEIPASSSPKTKKANDLITIIQNGNQAVNYDSKLREQSHRLIPILNTLREETGLVLNKSPEAALLYNEANTLHARNAETWGTKFMRNVRFSENPENIVSGLNKASNLRNLKQAIPNESIQDIAERLLVDNMTKSGSSSSNIKNLRNISPELSMKAQNAANELINVKDPLTNSGGRAVVRNEILKDAAQSVNTGKRPTKILDLMQTPKGYNLVRETLNQSQHGRELLQTFERLFVEDIFNAIREPSGQINFNKAKNIFKNNDIKQVTEMIGGQNITYRFDQLQTAANNFEKNISLFSNPETQSLVKSATENVKNAGVIGTLLHALHVPWPVILGLGLGKATAGTAKIGYGALQRKVLSNPKAVNLLENLSRATTKEEIAKQLPRLIKEINKEESQNK